jgi:hypothetical protein
MTKVPVLFIGKKASGGNISRCNFLFWVGKGDKESWKQKGKKHAIGREKNWNLCSK